MASTYSITPYFLKRRDKFLFNHVRPADGILFNKRYLYKTIEYLKITLPVLGIAKFKVECNVGGIHIIIINVAQMEAIQHINQIYMAP